MPAPKERDSETVREREGGRTKLEQMELLCDSKGPQLGELQLHIANAISQERGQYSLTFIIKFNKLH